MMSPERFLPAGTARAGQQQGTPPAIRDLPAPGAAPAQAHDSASLPAPNQVFTVHSCTCTHALKPPVPDMAGGTEQGRNPPFSSFPPMSGTGNAGSVLFDSPHSRGELNSVLGHLVGKLIEGMHYLPRKAISK